MRETARLVAQRQVADIRLAGTNIAVIPGSVNVRMLPVVLQDIVARVGARCQRELAGADAAASAPACPPGAAQATWRGQASPDFRREEVQLLASMPGLQPTLEQVAALTGMRFVAVARIAEKRWTALAVHDLLSYGLLPGQDLILESTICNEIRRHCKVVSFNQASTDQVFASHPTPTLYGFESYLSVPLVLDDGSFFGTLFALDIAPAALEAATIEAVAALGGGLARALSVASAAVGPAAGVIAHGAGNGPRG
jgi:GAF domain-containing protein